MTSESTNAFSPTPITFSSTPIPTQPVLSQAQEGQQNPLQQGGGEAQQGIPASQTEVLKRKPSRSPSNAWAHFNRESDRSICSYCKKSYACNNASHGTTNMLKHLKVWIKNPYIEFDKKQKTIELGKDCEDDPNTTVSMTLVEFNQGKTLIELAKMIIIDELAFKFVDNEGLEKFMGEAHLRFKIPSRVTIAKYCMQLFRSNIDS